MSSSKDKKRAAALQEKYQLLRSVTNSNAANTASILVDASKHIQELKEKIERLNQDISGCGSSSTSPCPKVSVRTLEKGFLVNVFSERSCPGLLVSILEAFEELGLEVLDAKASCTDRFELEAVGEENGVDSLDAQVVRQAVLQAIRNWSEST
ncbi:transcription factor bHLH61-like [Chenopodium quinoa]|uniref:Plant bHLH transcription factor ACT-like domain-containing protein n=1 Tax=Chenopodium quinoa TaxID=63459 RepID=A0A803L396_CHEQI|nr:transcription factor bHLH61-like [Chenopodium quinoa]